MAVTVSALANPIEYKVVVNTDTDTGGGTNVGYPDLLATSGTVYSIDIDNSGLGANTYILLYDAKTIVVGTTVPTMTLKAPASTRMVYNIPAGVIFSTAISIAGCTQGGTGNTIDPGSSIPVRLTCK